MREALLFIDIVSQEIAPRFPFVALGGDVQACPTEKDRQVLCQPENSVFV